MRGDGGYESATEVCHDGFGREVAIADRVEHGGVRAEKSTPTHTDGGEYGDGVAVNPAVAHESRYQTEGRSYSSKSGDGECHEMWVVEPEQPLKHEINLVGKPWQQFTP